MTALVTDKVFCNAHGEPYRSFRTAFERAVRKAGLVGLPFHDLRHTFASRLVMVGVDLPTVKELLGHKGIAMTLRSTHLSSDHKAAGGQSAGAESGKSPSTLHNTAIYTSRNKPITT